jgi:thiamine-monophosphate kinase
MDISDGLVKDLTEICDQSSVSANIRLVDIPVDPVLKKAFPDEYQDMALSGGEDYELIFTAPQRLMSKIIQNAKTPVSVIGEIVRKNKQAMTAFDSDGRVVKVKSTGWDQLR